MDAIRTFVDGKIDFQGQRLADRLMQEILTFGATFAFIIGYAMQSMQLCMLTFAAIVIVVAFITVPAYPMYNKHHVEWLPSRSATTTKHADADPILEAKEPSKSRQ